MKKTRRILGLGLAAAMMMSGAAGLADGVVLNDEGVTPIVKEGDVTLKIAITQSADVVDYNNGNFLTDHLAEMLGGKIEVDVWPSADAETKLTLMVTSGNELPDVLTFGATNWSTRNTYADAGALLNLDEYFAEGSGYSTAFYQRCEEAGMDASAVLNQVRSSDGSIYAFPQSDLKLPNVYSNRAYINQDFLDAVGMEAPKTIDELTEVLKAFRDKDPNGNGIADEIPLTGTKDWTGNGNALVWLQNMFVYFDGSDYRYDRLDNTDGKLDVVYDKDGYREFLKYVNMLVSEKLLDMASFTQDTATMRKALQADVQTVGMMCGSANGFGNNIASWQPLEQPKGPDGLQQVTYWPQNIGSVWIISADCKNPEAAVKLGMLGYIGDEQGLIARFGEPGVDWRYAEEGEESVFKELGIKPHIKCLNVTWATVSNKSWQNNVIPYLSDESTHIEVFDGNELYGERIHGRSVCMNMQYAPDKSAVMAGTIHYTEEEQDEWSELRTALKTYVQEATNLFCVGQLDPNSDADWQSYLDELNNLQYKEILAVDNEAYARTYGLSE